MCRIFLLIVIFFPVVLFSQFFSGLVTDEENNRLPAVLVFNVSTENRTYTSVEGKFNIEANPGDEIRFIRNGYERNSKIIQNSEILLPHKMVLSRIAAEIAEVDISKIILTGDLNTDAKNLSRKDRRAKLQKDIGVPGPPEKPREKPAEAVRDILMPLLSISPTINIQAIYNVLSGKARRQKNLYHYEDSEENIKWMTDRISPDYFIQMGIQVEEINSFLQFSIGLNPEIIPSVKAKNLSRVLFALEETAIKYKKLINVNKILKKC